MNNYHQFINIFYITDMKNLYAAALALSLLALPATMTGQNSSTDANEGVEGFYRLSNPAFGDTFTASSRFGFGFDLKSATDAGSVVYLKADELYSLIPQLEELEAKVNAGEIDINTYLNTMQELMTLNSWKSGYYPVQQFCIQGVDYAALIKKLADYADDAIEAFINTEVEDIWQNNRYDLMMMSIFTSGIITPADYETVESLSLWFENYLTRWRSIFDFALYLTPVNVIPDDDESPAVFNGKYHIRFRTPQWVGNMKKAQLWFNNLRASEDPDFEPLDIWATSMKRVLEAFAKDYPAESEAYCFVERLLSSIEADMQYCIGESEDGSLFCQPLPDAFGENGVVVSEDAFEQITWQFDAVDAEQPLAVAPVLCDADSYYYTTLCTGFAYQIASADVTAYYATAVNVETGEPTLAAIADGKVPALTPVVIRSRSSLAQDNCLVPVSDVLPAIEGNVLSGTLFAQDNTDQAVTLCMTDGKPVFAHRAALLDANTAYYTGQVASGIETLSLGAASQLYDLQGRKVSAAGQKGFYIVNGQKIIR